MRIPSEAVWKALLLLVLLGCRDMAQPERRPDPRAVKVGFLGNLANPVGSLQTAQGAQLAAAEINAAGGVNGQPIEVILADDLAGSVSGLPGTQSLLRFDPVAILGGPTSTLSLQALQLVGPAGVPLVSPAATSAALSSLPEAGDLFWRTAPSDAFQGVVLAKQIRASGVRSLGLIYRDDAYGQGLSAVFQPAFEALGGVLQSRVPYVATKTSGFGPEVARLFANGVPEGVLMVSLSAEGAALTRDLQLFDPRPSPSYFGGDGLFHQDFLVNAAGPVVEGMRGTSPRPPLDSAGYQLFLQAFRRSVGADPGAFSAAAYDALYLVAYALAAGGENSPQAVRRNLGAVSRPDGPSPVAVGVGDFARGLQVLRSGGDLDYNGASGRIDFDAHGDITSGTYTWWRVRNGAFETVETVTVP